MRFRVLIPPTLVLMLSATCPAVWAQSAQPAPATSTPATTTPAATNPAAEVMALDNGQNQACKRPVTVNEETRTWDALEKGTDEAWRAWNAGDYVKAVPVFQRLAKIGHPVAEVLVGYAHFYGFGVPLDYQQALVWLEKAADQGCFTAYELTAQIYDQGLGTAVDFGKAYMWFNIAASKLPNSAKRDDIMKLREAVAAKMTQAQVEAAQKRSLEFKPKLVVPPDLEELPADWATQN
jgi:hypothetical protein